MVVEPAACRSYALVHAAEVSVREPLTLDAATFRQLFDAFGPSLGLWRGAEIAALRSVSFARPVLDLGCGDGVVTSFVLENVEIGLDPWEQALKAAEARGVYKTLVAAEIESCTLPDASVRTIVSNSVLEHVQDIDPVLGSAARLLMPGGRLVFTAPTEAFGRWLLLPSGGYAAVRNRMYDHVNLWQVDTWRERLHHAGFEVIEVRPYLRRPLVALWDALELVQRIWLGRRRLFGEMWKRMPAGAMARLARAAAGLDLSAAAPGGGRMIVARRR